MDTDIITLEQLALELGRALQQRQLKLATVESCTGGMVAQSVTSVAGSSGWFEQGFIPYSNAAKQSMLGVKADSLEVFGAVSEEVAKEMALGALLKSQADCSLAITGVAGPGGGSAEKPVGMVWFAFVFQEIIETHCERFSGGRQAVRVQAARFALEKMLELVLQV